MAKDKTVTVVEVPTAGIAGNAAMLEEGRLSPSTGAVITAPVPVERTSMFLPASQPISKEICEVSLRGLLRADRENRRDHGRAVAAPIVRWLAEYLNFSPTTADLNKVWMTEDDEPKGPSTYVRFTQGGLDELNRKRAHEGHPPLDMDDPFHAEKPGTSPSKLWWIRYLGLARYERKMRKVEDWNEKTETPVTLVVINGVPYGSPVEALESGIVTLSGAYQAWKTATALVRIEDMADYVSGEAQYKAAREAAYWKDGDKIKSAFNMVVRAKAKDSNSNMVERKKRLPVIIGGEAASGACVGILDGLRASGGALTQRQFDRIMKALNETFTGEPHKAGESFGEPSAPPLPPAPAPKPEPVPVG